MYKTTSRSAQRRAGSGKPRGKRSKKKTWASRLDAAVARANQAARENWDKQERVARKRKAMLED